ncbi:hypothetical protein [Marivirga sp.]|uniref:hypothetical protein n=1 Tax=Marivirga sp. TaxID=2018662 RepID=UPI003DA715BA
MTTLQKALLSNGIFSGASGIFSAILPSMISEFLGIEETMPFIIIGSALMGFSIFLFLEIRKQRKLVVKAIIILDLIWVLGTIFILLFNPFGFSIQSLWILAFVGLIVLFFAVMQFIGDRKLA